MVLDTDYILIKIFTMSVALTFASAGTAKVLSGTDGNQLLAEWSIPASPTLKRIANTVPIAEVILAIWIASNYLLPISLGIAFCLMALFSFLHMMSMIKNQTRTCSCFGHQQRRVSWTTTLFNCLIGVSAAAAIVLHHSTAVKAIPSLTERFQLVVLLCFSTLFIVSAPYLLPFMKASR